MSDDFTEDPELLKEFLIEATEMLQGFDQDMVALESTPADAELLNRAFRALHTIKGTSGFLGLEPIIRVSHAAEDVLNRLRRGELALARPVMDLLLQARDQLGAMLADLQAGGLQQYSLEELLHGLRELASAPDLPGSVPLRLGEILVNNAVISAPELQTTLAEQSSSEESLRLGELLVKKGIANAADVGNAGVQQRELSTRAAAAASVSSMRVDVRKLDELINLIGELVLERNRLAQLSRDFCARRTDPKIFEEALSRCSARVSFVTDELQTTGLRTRMVPIETVFRRFPRLVRDVANALQKEVQLSLSGEDTELDKTMVELIADPLVHLVRNSLDHGLEPPEERLRQGKPRGGSIRLDARQEGDQILVSIADDGRGMDTKRIAAKAIEKGLVSSERAQGMSQRELLEFVFLPGFSTAERASDLSGRGVGMDVVRTNLKRMNGSIEIESEAGAGTTVRLRLPLTLAILPVLLVQVGEEVYALPLRSVVDTAMITADRVHRCDGEEFLCMRDETLPLLRLDQLFGAAQTRSSPDKVVILSVGDKRVALLVDRLIGQESTVIKPLGTLLHNCVTLAGATISGDGRVRLVLDPAGLLAAAKRAEREQVHA